MTTQVQTSVFRRGLRGITLVMAVNPWLTIAAIYLLALRSWAATGTWPLPAHPDPKDIDAVHPGLRAQVALTAFSRRNVPPVEAKVVSVSADSLTDERSGQPYFLAIIDMPQMPYEPRLELDLYPGMQAEVMIVTGEDTPLNYILRPALQSFGRALREK